MCQVIDAVDEGNLLLISFYRHKLPIHNQEAAETLGIAVGERDLVVVWEGIQLRHERSVRRINALADAGSERAGACAFQVCQEQWFIRSTVIDTEACTAIFAPVTLQSSP